MTADGIWKLPLAADAAEEQVSDFDRNAPFRWWALGAQGAYIALPGPKPQIDLLPFAGDRVPIVALPAELPKSSRCFSVYPYGRSFLFPIREADHWEIYLCDNPVSK